MDGPSDRTRRIAVWALLLTIIANVSLCVSPGRSLARLSDDRSSIKDPAAASVIELVRGIRDRNPAALEACLPSGPGRLRVEYTLLFNPDPFRSAQEATVRREEQGDGTEPRRLLLSIMTPFGTMPYKCEVSRGSGGRWVVSAIEPPTRIHWSTFPAGDSEQQTLLTVSGDIPPSVRAAVVARLTSKNFARIAIADAGLAGAMSVDLVPQLWTAGWEADNQTLGYRWQVEGQVPEPFAISRMASHELLAALECRGVAEAADIILRGCPGLKPSARREQLLRSFESGDDQTTLSAIDRMAADPASNLDRRVLSQLAGYLRTNRVSPAAVAAAAGYDHLAKSEFANGSLAYRDVVMAGVIKTLTTGGFPEPVERSKYAFWDRRSHDFTRIYPPILR
jgi:hypothetical protein